MSTVIQPAAFSEKFTVRIDADGKPVQRALREMTAGEVIAAVERSAEEVDRLAREALPAEEIAVALEEGRHEALAGMTGEEVWAAQAALRAAGEAMERHAGLLSLIHGALPEWQEPTRKAFHDALLHHWPGGPHNVIEAEMRDGRDCTPGWSQARRASRERD
jgi:hypothetical protein